MSKDRVAVQFDFAAAASSRSSSKPTISSNGPNVIGNSSFHGWRSLQGLMDAPEVVVHHVKRHGSGVILDLFAESVG